MSIAILNSILCHPPSLAPNCLKMHLFCRDQPEIYLVTFSTVYISDLYNTQAPRSFQGVYSLDVILYYPIIYPLYTLLGLKIYTHG